MINSRWNRRAKTLALTEKENRYRHNVGKRQEKPNCNYRMQLRTDTKERGCEDEDWVHQVGMESSDGIILKLKLKEPCTMGTGSFQGVKRQGHCADHPPPSNTEVKRM
jgi:hypothetical protein